MTSRRPIAVAILIGLLCAAAGFGGGWWIGDQRGRRDGFAIGKRYAEVEAGKKNPIPVRDERISALQLARAGGFDRLPDLSVDEQTRLVGLLNSAPSPCRKYARRGLSLARSIASPDEAGCGTERDQVPLALAALRSFEDSAEAVAVLRVERRAYPETEGRPRRGGGDGAMVLVEYSDFQCPYCVRAHKRMVKLLEGRDDIALVYKHLPLSMHKSAMAAALAAEAASEQGKFWEMHDALFALGRSIGAGVDGEPAVPEAGPVHYEEQAEALGLDIDRYRADYRSEAVRARVDADAAEAERLGVRGTPTFLLGGARIRPGPSADRLTRQIARARAEAGGTFTWDLPPLPAGVDPTTVSGSP